MSEEGEAKMAAVGSILVRRCLAGNAAIREETMLALAQDPEPLVRMSVANNPSTPSHVLQHLAQDPHEGVAEIARKNPHISEAEDRLWNDLMANAAAVVSEDTAEKEDAWEASLRDKTPTELDEAKIRIAASQFAKLGQTAAAAYAGRGSQETIARFLGTELGKGSLMAVLSVFLYGVKDRLGESAAVYLEQMSREMRVGAMSRVSDEMADIVMGPLRTIMAEHIKGVASGDVPAPPAAPPAELPEHHDIETIIEMEREEAWSRKKNPSREGTIERSLEIAARKAVARLVDSADRDDDATFRRVWNETHHMAPRPWFDHAMERYGEKAIARREHMRRS
jgi:hypothetical protein